MMKILILAVILVFLVSCTVEPESLPKTEDQGDIGPIIEPEEPTKSPDDTVSKENYGEDEVNEKVGFAGITEEQCTEANGYWNECGSPCAGTDADFCVQVCQVQCECNGIAGFGCPEGFKCRLTGKIADEMGVCVKE